MRNNVPFSTFAPNFFTLPISLPYRLRDVSDVHHKLGRRSGAFSISISNFCLYFVFFFPFLICRICHRGGRSSTLSSLSRLRVRFVAVRAPQACEITNRTVGARGKLGSGTKKRRPPPPHRHSSKVKLFRDSIISTFALAIETTTKNKGRTTSGAHY